MIAHIGGVPVEETLLPLVTGLGAGLLLARSWIAARLRRRGTGGGRRPAESLGGHLDAATTAGVPDPTQPPC